MIWQKPFDALAAECGISQDLIGGFTEISQFYETLRP